MMKANELQCSSVRARGRARTEVGSRGGTEAGSRGRARTEVGSRGGRAGQRLVLEEAEQGRGWF